MSLTIVPQSKDTQKPQEEPKQNLQYDQQSERYQKLMLCKTYFVRIRFCRAMHMAYVYVEILKLIHKKQIQAHAER